MTALAYYNEFDPYAAQWLDTVQTDMEIADYAFRAADTCAAGFGAPHIRQRLYWMADADRDEPRAGRNAGNKESEGLRVEPGRRSTTGRLEHAESYGWIERGPEPSRWSAPGGCSIGGLGNPECVSPGRNAGTGAETERGAGVWPIGDNSGSSGPVDGPGPTNGFWRAADWLYCRDERWRPVEPGTQPLAHGASSRVGRLRAYGNAINLAQAEGFLRAALY